MAETLHGDDCYCTACKLATAYAHNRRELPPDHPTRQRIESGSAAAKAAMPSMRLPLPRSEEWWRERDMFLGFGIETTQEEPMILELPDDPSWQNIADALRRAGYNKAAGWLESWVDEYLPGDEDKPLTLGEYE